MSGNMLLLADAASRTTFELGRDLSTPISWIAPTVVMLVLVWFVVGMYLLDCVELGGRFATLLIGIRLLAFVAILAVYLQPQWRTTRDVVNNSRVLVLADTSQSMGRRDVASDDVSSAGGLESRIDRVVRELAAGELIPELRQVHDVMVYRFDQDDKPTPVASFAKLAPADGGGAMTDQQVAALQSGVNLVRRWLAIAGGRAAVRCALFRLVLDPAGGDRQDRSGAAGRGRAGRDRVHRYRHLDVYQSAGDEFSSVRGLGSDRPGEAGRRILGRGRSGGG